MDETQNGNQATGDTGEQSQDPSSQQPTTGQSSTQTVHPLQQQFDSLVQQKIALWDQIKDMQLYELTDQWKQIAVIDKQLLELRAQIEGGK